MLHGGSHYLSYVLDHCQDRKSGEAIRHDGKDRRKGIVTAERQLSWPDKRVEPFLSIFLIHRENVLSRHLGRKSFLILCRFVFLSLEIKKAYSLDPSTSRKQSEQIPELCVSVPPLFSYPNVCTFSFGCSVFESGIIPEDREGLLFPFLLSLFFFLAHTITVLSLSFSLSKFQS